MFLCMVFSEAGLCKVYMSLKHPAAFEEPFAIWLTALALMLSEVVPLAASDPI